MMTSLWLSYIVHSVGRSKRFFVSGFVSRQTNEPRIQTKKTFKGIWRSIASVSQRSGVGVTRQVYAEHDVRASGLDLV